MQAAARLAAAAAVGSDARADVAGDGAETRTEGVEPAAAATAEVRRDGKGAPSLIADMQLLRQLQAQPQSASSCAAAAGAATSAGVECVPDLNALLRLVTSTGAPLYQMAAQVGASGGNR
jgi:hypothetical protein